MASFKQRVTADQDDKKQTKANDEPKGDLYTLATCPISGKVLGSIGDAIVKEYDGPLGFDQRPLLEAEHRPMLFLMGEKDQNGPYRANRDEILRLAGLSVDVTLVSYAEGQHVLEDIDFWPDLWNWLSTKGFQP